MLLSNQEEHRVSSFADVLLIEDNDLDAKLFESLLTDHFQLAFTAPGC